MKQPKGERSVRFVDDEDNQIYTIPCISVDDHVNIWYNIDEYNEILQRCQSEIKLMKLQQESIKLGTTLEEEVDDELFTSRGLEQALSLSSKMKVNSVHVRSILDEQDRLLRSPGYYKSSTANSPVDMAESLALVAERTSKHRQRMAHLIALRDEQAVTSYLKSANQHQNIIVDTSSAGSDDPAATVTNAVGGSESVVTTNNCWTKSNSSPRQNQQQRSSFSAIMVPNKELRRENRRRRLATSSQLRVLC